MMTQRLNHNRKETRQIQETRYRIPTAALAAVMFASALSATATLAAPLTVNDMKEIGSVEFSFSDRPKDIFLTGHDSVTLRFDYDGVDDGNYDKSQAVWAGAFGGQANPVENDPFDPTTLYRSQDQVVLYCLDIFNDLQYGQGFVEYNVFEFGDDEDAQPTTTTTDVATELSATGSLTNVLDFLGALNDVLGETEYWVEEDDGEDGWVQYGTYSFGDRNWLNPANRWVSGAIQAGIWESLYDYDNGMNINAGHFSVTGLSDDGQGLLGAAFDQMAYSDSLDSSQVLLFQPVDGGQTLIGDPVPTPGSFVLLLSGLLLLGRMGWERRPHTF